MKKYKLGLFSCIVHKNVLNDLITAIYELVLSLWGQ